MKTIDYADLAIGDFIEGVYTEEDLVNDCEVERHFWVRVEGVDENASIGEGWFISFENIGKQKFETADAFYPIPLSIKLLKNMGAVLDIDDINTDDEFDYYFPDFFDFNTINFTYFKKENRFQFSVSNGENCSIYKECKSVHEFQHLLREAGYKEFANTLNLPDSKI